MLSVEQQVRDFIEPLRRKMQEYALQNPCRTHQELEEQIRSGKSAETIPYTDSQSIGIIVTIAPDDSEQSVFWHLTASVVTAAGPKPRVLWTRRDRSMISSILTLFSENTGKSNTQQILPFAKSLHIHKELTAAEHARVKERHNG